MTEQEWLTSEDPTKMLAWVMGNTVPPGARLGRQIISDRKLRLFACACVRQAWERLTDVRSRYAVEIAERYADELATEQQRAGAWNTSMNADHGDMKITYSAARCAESAEWIRQTPGIVSRNLEGVVPLSQQADLLRDSVGNPFRRDIYWEESIDGKHLGTTHYKPVPRLTPTVLSLADAAYEERTGRICDNCRGVSDGQFGPAGCPQRGGARLIDGELDPTRLSILADALEEAGCQEEDCWRCGGHGWLGRISLVSETRNKTRQCEECNGSGRCHPLLAHLRSPGPHVRGCWAIDLLLGKG